jgi:hypothetical protein
MRTQIERFIVSTVLSAIVLVGIAVSSVPPVGLFDGRPCKDNATCAKNADISAMVDEMLAEQTAKYPRCVDPKAFKGVPARVLVRDSKGGDSGVVRSVSFDVAWHDAKAGKVYVLKLCK